MSPKPQDSLFHSTAWALPSPTTTTTVIQTSISAALKPTDSFKTAETAPLSTSQKHLGFTTPDSVPAAHGSITTKTDTSISTSANYVEWSIENDLFCTLDGKNKSYCTPESYTGQSSKLFRNRGNGTFADVSRIARIENNTSKSLGVCIFDYNADGLPDIFEANDTQPNKLYQNNGDSTFIETALEVGVSHDEKGVATGAMGVDAADYDRTGKESLVIGNFSNEMLNLYHNDGGFFIDDAPAAHIGNATLLTLTFACFFFDFDLDGNLDIFTANGHVENDINAIQSQVTYAQPPHLFHNDSHGKFTDALPKVGADLAKPMVGRGAAYGDIDNDGDWDLLVTTSNGPAHLFRNDGGNHNAWIKIQLVGQKSNRDGIGARIRITSALGTQTPNRQKRLQLLLTKRTHRHLRHKQRYDYRNNRSLMAQRYYQHPQERQTQPTHPH